MPVDAARLRQLIADELESVIALRRDLHAHPELAYDERRTSGVVLAELERAGVPCAGGLAGGTGVLGHLAGDAAQAVGLRADLDALPIAEATEAPHASTRPGLMHACGHDGHTAILIGAARVLARLGALPRPVSFIFQPAEEGGGGAQRMIEDGCLDGSRLGPPVAQVFALHGWPELPLGEVAVRPGPVLAAQDTFSVRIVGTGAHAAWPNSACDPIVAGAAVVSAVQSIVARNVDPLQSAVVSITQFHAGTTHNIIPGQAELAGTVRALDAEVHRLVRRRFRELVEGVTRAHGCQAHIDYKIGYPATVNDTRAAALVERQARAVVGAERVVRLEHPGMGAEDFAYYCQQVPSCFFMLGMRPEQAARYPSLHQPDFDFNDHAIATGIEVLCRLALHE